MPFASHKMARRLMWRRTRSSDGTGLGKVGERDGDGITGLPQAEQNWLVGLREKPQWSQYMTHSFTLDTPGRKERFPADRFCSRRRGKKEGVSQASEL